ncbi:N-acetylgalactosamine kinase [Leptopilina boulardi]|uniref:N-acetylgalactosamine kinase n=1 Tax=Leptopilina boulardi TaxID=63433 RepID=UPI0021F6336E|nr:N-acetylgalactosamine kinase [Leptopilina boulardi]XP_051172247.1 N-acetylgalactosamine kinase [Leptopilina boulardi]
MTTESIKQNEDNVPLLEADELLKNKMELLTNHFRDKFNCPPSFFVRVPGRVNIIGEHVDYCGYAVCPMAIQQFILVAVAPSETDEFHVSNFDPKYTDFKCQDFKGISNRNINNSNEGPDWHKYFLCGIKGILEIIPKENIPNGMLAAVWGNIPANSGLSSSSALVSAAALSTVHVCQYSMTKEQLATISASAERYIGTMGGGMDQAIAFLGKAGSAKLIEFNPLRATNITLPEHAVFVIAHSLVCHNKASTTDFNLRVAECRFAAQILAKKRNVNWKTIQKLIDIQEGLKKNLKEMIEIVMADIKDEPYTLNEILEILETTIEELEIYSIKTSFNLSQKYKLRQRALHVFQEALRVMTFQRINEDKTIKEDVKLQQLGNLMSKSHFSLCKLYECSHPQVDALVNSALDSGALGARLTGAGWGGCVVAITTRDNVEKFLEALIEKYYNRQDLQDADIKDLVFPTEPCQGAAIYISKFT